MEYIVKSIATAKDNNPNFAGETRTFYHGKGGRVYDKPEWTPGWSRKHFAVSFIRNALTWESTDMYWTYRYEIITK